jgi:hypothetical protein
MERILGQHGASLITDTLARYVRPIFRNYVSRSGSLGAHVLVMHIRGGAVFAGEVTYHWYVQPPAAYYIRAFEYAALCLGVSAVHVVFEDKGNPSVDIVLEYLSRRKIPCSFQSSSLLEDMATIMSAEHIAAPHGTFCEAAGLLSNTLKTYFGFRTIATQEGLGPFRTYWAQDRVEEILWNRGVRTIVIDDPDQTYIRPGAWDRSPEQLNLMRTFPLNKLRLMERRRDWSSGT